ncbi:putative Ig domain-containing protein [Desulfococcus sp.]|uniref:putative Ig domain-containing protein n=1 Tax=Desulfococcus sp. TaxID=2025834 RepID=UPI003593E385
MRNIKRFHTARWYGMLGTICLVFLMLSCSGGGGGSQESGSPTGSGQILLTLQIDESGMDGYGLKQTGAEFDCVGNHIDTIEILVKDASGNEIAQGGPFDCTGGTGTVSDVPAGIGYTVQVNAFDEGGVMIFSGEVTGVTVLPNQVNAVGPVILLQVKNREPRIEPPIGDKTVLEGELLLFTVTAEDPDAAQTLTFETGVLPRGAVFDAETGVFSWTPGFTDAGAFQVFFRVVDDWEGDPASDAETINILVGDVNGPPTMAPPGNYRIDEGETVSFAVTASDPDPGDTLAFSAGDLPRGASFNPATGNFTWETGFEDSGNYTVTFRVTDDGNPPGSDSKSAAITVGNVNRPPILDPIGNREVDQGEILEIVVTARDPDGDNLTFSAANLPTGALFDPQGQTFSWQPGTGDIGTHTVLYSVADDGEPPLGDSEEITITVGTGNRPPELNPIGNRSVDEGALLEIVVTGRDPDNDPLVYSAENLPPGAAFDPQTQRFTWQTGFEDAGNYPVTFIVSDVREDSLSDAETITITVGDVNRPPVMSPIGTRTIDLSVSQEISFTVTAIDPDGDPLTYDVIRPPEGSTFENQVFRWRPDIPDIGIHIVTFRASDNQDPPLSDTEDGRVIVTYPPPTVVSTSPASGQQGVDSGISSISAVFSREMDPATIPQAFIVEYFTDGVFLDLSGSVSVSGRTATFRINETELPLPFGTIVRATIFRSARDTRGVGMASDYQWTFTTEIPG